MSNPASRLSELPPMPVRNSVYQEAWTFPAGTEYSSMDPQLCGTVRQMKRETTVVPRWVDQYGHAIIVGWAGSGGYWKSVSIPIIQEDEDA